MKTVRWLTIHHFVEKKKKDIFSHFPLTLSSLDSLAMVWSGKNHDP